MVCCSDIYIYVYLYILIYLFWVLILLLNFNICEKCLSSVLTEFLKHFLGRCITSLCWRPDGKAIAVGLEDGTVSLHDVEVSSLNLLFELAIGTH